MGTQGHQKIRLGMEFFPPPTGNVSVKQGFPVEIPEPIAEFENGSVQSPTTVNCVLSENTSHSMATESILQKISGKFLWVDGTTRENLYKLKVTETYFFTSALGDACQEDRDKGEAVTPQLEVLGTLSLYFRVCNHEGKDRDQVRTHQFHLPHILVVKELFSNQPSLTAARAARFELCLGQDFFQAYPHLLFEFTPSPACDIIISSVHMNHHPTISVDLGGFLHLCAAGVCITAQESEQQDVMVQGGFGVYFARNSVYNTFHHLPALGSGVKDQGFRKDGLAASFGNAPPKDAPSRERASLASLVLAMEMVISLHHLGYAFNGVKIRHNCSYFCVPQQEARITRGTGLTKPNNDLIHRLFLLQDVVEDSGGCEVKLFNVDDREIMPAIKLAELGAQMWAFTGSMTFIERCLSIDCGHPAQVHSNQIGSPYSDLSNSASPASPGSSNIRFDFASVAGDAPYQINQRLKLEQSFSPNSNETTVNRSRRGSVSRQNSLKLKGKLVSRVPMFLNYGSTITYVSQGKLVAFTPQGLFLLSKETAKCGLDNLESTMDNKLDGITDCQVSGGDYEADVWDSQPGHGERFPEVDVLGEDIGALSKKYVGQILVNGRNCKAKNREDTEVAGLALSLSIRGGSTEIQKTTQNRTDTGSL